MSRTGAKKSSGLPASTTRSAKASGSKPQVTHKSRSKSKSTLQAKTSHPAKKACTRSQDEEMRRKLDQSLGRMTAKQSVQPPPKSKPQFASSIEAATQEMQKLSQND